MKKEEIIKKYEEIQRGIYKLADEMEEFTEYLLAEYLLEHWEEEFQKLIEELNQLWEKLEKEYERQEEQKIKTQIMEKLLYLNKNKNDS